MENISTSDSVKKSRGRPKANKDDKLNYEAECRELREKLEAVMLHYEDKLSEKELLQKETEQKLEIANNKLKPISPVENPVEHSRFKSITRIRNTENIKFLISLSIRPEFLAKTEITDYDLEYIKDLDGNLLANKLFELIRSRLSMREKGRIAGI